MSTLHLTRRLTTDREIIKRVEAQDDLSFVLTNVRPTQDLIDRCYKALAQAGVTPLPVRTGKR